MLWPRCAWTYDSSRGGGSPFSVPRGPGFAPRAGMLPRRRELARTDGRVQASVEGFSCEALRAGLASGAGPEVGNTSPPSRGGRRSDSPR